jgi:putative methyltransferase (TIGR04325 family)
MPFATMLHPATAEVSMRTGNEYRESPPARAVWVGQYESRHEAQSALATRTNQEDTDLFALPSWLRRQGLLVDRIDPDPQSILNSALPRPTNLPLVCSGGGIRRIVDYGGGSGWVFEACERVTSSIDQYVVIDSAEVVAAYLSRRTSPIHFVTFDESDRALHEAPFDVVYSNSALQYAGDNQGLMILLRNTRPRLLLIDELLWSLSDRDWFTLQVNSDVPVISRFASLPRLQNDLKECGYRVAWTGSFGGSAGYAFPDMSEFDDDHRIDHAMSLLFTREP